MSNEMIGLPLLVVLGATGNQGGAVLKYFAASQSQHVRLRGVTRNPDSFSSQELVRLGIEMVKGDLEDLASLQSAFNGATYIFATTDSNRIIYEAIKHPELLSEGQTPRSYAQVIEMNYGKNIADAAAATPTLKRLVWSSLASPKKWSNGKYANVTMFDAKEEIADLLQGTPGLEEKLSLILIGFYATNALHTRLSAPIKQADGTYEFALPMSGDLAVPIIDLDRSLGQQVNALFHTDPGTILVGATSTISWKQWLEMWGRENKVPTSYRRASFQEFGAQLPGMSEALAEEFAFIDEFGFTGGMKDVMYPDQLRQRGFDIGQATIEEHIRNCDWSSIL